MKPKFLLLLLMFAIALAGCGGGSAGAPAGGGALFMTDSLDGHSHVWITVEKVVLTGSSGAATVYDDPVGTTIDLKTLRDANGNRYSFLATAPAGTYSAITVTVDKTVTLFDQGNPNGYTRVFAGNNGTTADLSLTFGTPITLGPGINVALDFNLSNWSDDGATITGTPFLLQGDGSGLGDMNRHEHEGYEGVVQGLAGTAPDQTFNLVRGTHSVAVLTNIQTVVFNSDGSTTPVLADGERVEITGAFDTTQNALVADSVKIQVGTDGDSHHPRAEGPVSNIDANAFTFVLTVDEARGFQPTDATVDVTTSDTTVFIVNCGTSMAKADFFAALADGQAVEVEGTYDPGTNTFAADKVRLTQQDGGHDHHSQVSGPISNLDSVGATFDVTAHDWEGLNIGRNAVVHIVTDGTTTFNDGGMTAEQWFAAAVAGQGVEVQGTFDPGTMTLSATSVSSHH